eukprot:SAG31_NODE_444_length_15625_cov_6.047469_6_plen_245_part_00
MALPLATPESVGLSSDALQKITAWQKDMVREGKLPCAHTVVARSGKVVYSELAGEQNPGTPLSESTLYRIYSMTKPITTVALMMLYDRGKFGLEDPVHFFLGEKWKKEKMKVYVSGGVDDMITRQCTRSITMRMVMNHTSGLSYGFDASGTVNPVDGLYFREKRGIHARGVTLKQMVDDLADMPLFFTPGEHWHYSLATDVCGRLVEAISGQPFETFVREQLLIPLGMHDTNFFVSSETRPLFA